MTSPYYPSGPSAPTINGNDWTVDRWLVSPQVITNQVQQTVERQSIAPVLFRSIDAPTGTLLYEEATLAALGVDPDVNRQPGEVRPGEEFPWVGLNDTPLKPVQTRKYGGQFAVTDEQRRRDSRDLVGQGVRRLSNTLALNSNTRAVNAFTNNPNVTTQAASAIWATGNTAGINDILAAVSTISNNGFGYTPDTVVMTPQTALKLLQNATLWNTLPRENQGRNVLLNPQLSGLLNIPNWLVTPVAAANEVVVAASKVVGGIATEVPLKADVVDDRLRQRTVVIVSQADIPVITDPKAAVRITGVNS